MMRLQIAGAEVEVSGQSAEDVRAVAERMAEVLTNRKSSHSVDGPEKGTRGEEREYPPGEPSTDTQSHRTRVFVSHSSHDVGWIESELIPLLRDAGLAPWYSKDDVRTAEYWERQILAALKRCDWFLIVLSPRSAASEWVKDELHWAIANRENRIIPVLIEPCDLHDFHIRLSRIEFADWFGDREKARKKIIEVVCGSGAKPADDSTDSVRRRWWQFWK
jgi:hypothetical protein